MEDNECPCLKSALGMEIVGSLMTHIPKKQSWVSKADDNSWEGVILPHTVYE